MIDRGEFRGAWEFLCARFGREDDPRQAAAYYGFLSERMETPEFLQAAKTLWATEKWFPRPADFLLVAGAKDWPLVLASAERFCPPAWEWTEPYGQMSERGRDACVAMGGMTAVRKLWEKDIAKLKAEWEKAFEQTMTAAVIALPPSTMRERTPRRVQAGVG